MPEDKTSTPLSTDSERIESIGTAMDRSSSEDSALEEITPAETAMEEVLVEDVEPTNPYPQAVYESFLENSVRSALLIDDQFPMFDTPEGELGNYEQAERAKRLYRTFKHLNIICDIESRPSELEAPSNTDRLLKSDLVILDYHLDKGDETPKKALAILKNLAESKHFNVVALYTDCENLDKVWLEVAATLKGGWKDPENLLSESQQEKWDDLESEDTMPSPTKELLVSFLENGATIAMREQAGREFRQQFIDGGVTQQECKEILIARISKEFSVNILQNGTYDAKPCNIIAGSSNNPMWLQSGNLFVAILKKIEPEEEDKRDFDPEKIWERLTAAIKDWQPNLLQIMMSEIQNILEVEGVTIDPEYAGSRELQAGILYSLFNTIPPDKTDNAKNLLRPAIEALTWKLVESIRRKISTNQSLVERAEKLVMYEISKNEWSELPAGNTKERPKEMLKFIKNQLFRNTSIIDQNLFFELNAFLSSDAFRGSHLTTGTVFKLENKDTWWMCCSPACDMEPRVPNKWKDEGDTWHQKNHPTKKMVALRLELKNSHTTGMQKASRGKQLFIKSGGEKYQFHVLNEYNHPNWEVLLLDKSDTPLFKGKDLDKVKFKAYLIKSPEGESCKIEKEDFIIVAQIRPEYANRILQFTGHHLSRIGVDYVSLP